MLQSSHKPFVRFIFLVGKYKPNKKYYSSFQSNPSLPYYYSFIHLGKRKERQQEKIASWMHNNHNNSHYIAIYICRFYTPIQYYMYICKTYTRCLDQSIYLLNSTIMMGKNLCRISYSPKKFKFKETFIHGALTKTRFFT